MMGQRSRNTVAGGVGDLSLLSVAW